MSDDLGDWRDDAACRYVDPAEFDDPDGTPEAAAACQACPVTFECLDFLLTNPVQAGFGAGLTEQQRRERSKRRHGRRVS